MGAMRPVGPLEGLIDRRRHAACILNPERPRRERAAGIDSGDRKMVMGWKAKTATLALVAGLGLTGAAHAQTTIKAVMHSDLKIVDPIWTTAYIVRNHGYMIYDTLFALDEKGEVKPQMVDTFTESPDKLTYTFKLATACSGTTRSRSRRRIASPRSSAGRRATRSARR
jgi:hypothetical protein